jgi:hypothetical protein
MDGSFLGGHDFSRAANRRINAGFSRRGSFQTPGEFFRKRFSAAPPKFQTYTVSPSISSRQALKARPFKSRI